MPLNWLDDLKFDKFWILLEPKNRKIQNTVRIKLKSLSSAESTAGISAMLGREFAVGPRVVGAAADARAQRGAPGV